MREWRDVVLPPEVERVPTMLSRDEQKLLYWLARDRASRGAIVDAGCFLGGSTVALLGGLRDRPSGWTGPPVVSYDKFRVAAYEVPQFFRDTPLAVGDSFRSLFDANVAGYGVPHTVREGDITEIGWSGGRIEILFLDVLKSWKINDAVLRDFFPHLSVGSVIVQQDYGWGAGPWIHITMELLRDSVRLVDYMKAGSHVYVVERKLNRRLLRRGLLELSGDEQLELMDAAVARAEGWPRGMVELARARVIAYRDRPAALREVTSVLARYDDEYVRLSARYTEDELATGPDLAGVRHAERVAREEH
jgi:hypothetical protein